MGVREDARAELAVDIVGRLALLYARTSIDLSAADFVEAVGSDLQDDIELVIGMSISDLEERIREEEAAREAELEDVADVDNDD